MKKILGTTLAAALLIPGPANAEILKNLKVNGQLDIQANSARNASDFSTRGDSVLEAGEPACGAGANLQNGCRGNDRVGSAVTRLLVDLKWDLLDDIHANVTMRKNSRAWGANGAASQGASGSQSIGAVGNTDILGSTFLDQANITIDKAVNSIDMTLGRQYYGDAGDLIIAFGPKDNYGLYVTAIDAARFDWSNDWLGFSGLAGKTVSGGMAAGMADTDVRGFDMMWKSLPVKTHTYLWNQVKQGAGALGSGAGKNDNLWVYGVKLRGEAMGGWIGLDAAANAGEDRKSLTSNAAGDCNTGAAGTVDLTPHCNASGSNYTGKAFLLDAGYNAEMSGIGALTPWVNFGYGTGRSSNFETRNEGFTAIATDYRPGIMNRRFSQGIFNLGAGSAAGAVNTAGLNNRVVYGAGLNVTPAAWEKLTIGAQLWSFNLQRVTQTAAIAGAANTSARGAKHLGTEYGITADWKHSENVKYGFGGAIYNPGGVVKQAIGSANGTGVSIGDNPATLAFADISVKF